MSMGGLQDSNNDVITYHWLLIEVWNALLSLLDAKANLTESKWACACGVIGTLYCKNNNILYVLSLQRSTC